MNYMVFISVLVAIEFKLSQALMNKRLEIKDNTMAKMFVTKDLNVSIWTLIQNEMKEF